MHLARRDDQAGTKLFVQTISQSGNVTVLVVNWLMQVFALCSILTLIPVFGLSRSVSAPSVKFYESEEAWQATAPQHAEPSFDIRITLDVLLQFLARSWFLYVTLPLVPYVFYITTPHFTNPLRARSRQLYGRSL